MRVSLRLTLLTILALILGSVVYFSNRSAQAGETQLRTLPATDRVSGPGDPFVKNRPVLSASVLPPAGNMFGVTSLGDSSDESIFHSINASSGEATVIGKVGFSNVGGMDFQPSTGILYATGRRLGDGELVLLTIDTISGQGTEVGPLGAAGGSSNVQDITFRNSDSVLFGCQNGKIITIDTTTGTATLIGDTGNSSGGNGLAFSPTDTLYLANRDAGLLTINQSDASTTPVANLTYSQTLNNPRISAMEFSTSASTFYGAVMASEGSFLATVDTSNGNVSIIGQTAEPMEAIAVTAGCIPPPPDMVSFWPGEGNGHDIRGDNNGTLKGSPTFPTGEVEHAFGLNGTNQYVSIPDDPSLQVSNLTIDAWVNFNSLHPDHAQTIFGKALGSSNSDSYVLWYQGGALHGQTCSNSTCSVLDYSWSPALGTWHHVAFTFDGSSDVLYVDGVSVVSGDNNVVPEYDTHAALIGADYPGDINSTIIDFFDGNIDEVELFRRALSGAEIGNIYNAGSFGKCRPRCLTPPSGLVGWWTGDRNSFDIWYPNQNHGTFESGAASSPSPSPSPSPYADGKVGDAFNFNGIDTYVDLDNYQDLQLSDAITIDAWVRPTAIPGGIILFKQDGQAKPNASLSSFEGILTKWQSTQTLLIGSAKPEQVPGDSYGLWLFSPFFIPQGASGSAINPDQTGGTLVLYGAVETSCDSTVTLVGGTVPIDVWSHVAMTYDGSSGIMSLYINGVKVADNSQSNPQPNCFINQTDTQVNIGCQTCGRATIIDPFEGQIDEVEVFGRALQQVEIQTINNAGFAGKCKPCYPPPSNLVGWWTGDANTRDESLNGNDAAWQGTPAYAFGEVGQAYKFDATADSGVIVPPGNFLNPSSEITLDAWVNPSSFPNNGPAVIRKDTNNVGTTQYSLNVGDGTTAGVAHCNIGGTGVEGGSIPLNEWTHLACTYKSGDPGSLVLYVNGIPVNSINDFLNPIPTASPDTNIAIGKEDGFNDRNFDGLIDEVEIFDRALVQPEIQSIVAAGPSGKCKASLAACSDCARPDNSAKKDQADSFDQVADVTVLTDELISSLGIDYQNLPLYQQGPLPFGYTEPPLEIADIKPTVFYFGQTHVCFDLQAVTDLSLFQQLRILHLEGNVLVDRTSSRNSQAHTLCAIVDSLSPFVIAQNASQAPTAEKGSIGGQITDSNGAPVAGVTLRLSGADSRVAITDSGGHYNFDGLEANGFYTIVPSRVNYTFSPTNRSFSLLGAHIEASFTAHANSGSKLNPLDTTEFFVRQQYLDFLGREPDPPGFAGWVNTINNCPAGDTSCDRIHVSEMFYRSAEFQERGYFAYRFYSTALGRKPDFAEFMPDLARVSGFLTREELEAAKVAFIDDFMVRPAFITTYSALSNAAYVDKLSQTAGVTLSNRQALIDALDARSQTRAQVLRQIAESGAVYQKYYNQAFVVMEYFGYLRRDPDALYLDWINLLNQGGSARHMVEGFVDSIEYRNRFAQ